MPSISMLWRRLDTPGHDACQLQRTDGGWTIEGLAVFRDEGGPARLHYRVECDGNWRSRRGEVHGWLGEQPFERTLARSGTGAWTLDGAVVPGLEDCIDLDLGFTPATNLVIVRRLALAVGESADAPAAWLNMESRALELLGQRYERLSASIYAYEAPSVPYTGLLEVFPNGFIRRYPRLWEAEP